MLIHRQLLLEVLDADTQAAIAGSIASAYWEVPQDIYKPAINILNDELRDILFKFNDISL